MADAIVNVGFPDAVKKDGEAKGSGPGMYDREPNVEGHDLPARDSSPNSFAMLIRDETPQKYATKGIPSTRTADPGKSTEIV